MYIFEPGSSKGCWMDDVWGAYTPSFRIKQHPSEDAGNWTLAKERPNRQTLENQSLDPPQPDILWRHQPAGKGRRLGNRHHHDKVRSPQLDAKSFSARSSYMIAVYEFKIWPNWTAETRTPHKKKSIFAVCLLDDRDDRSEGNNHQKNDELLNYSKNFDIMLKMYLSFYWNLRTFYTTSS